MKIAVTGKGGVGKTTTVANIGTGLASLGHKVVLLDTDIGLRNLDVVMGLENRIVYDIVDAATGQCKLKQAMIKDKRFENMYLIPAAQTKDKNAVNESQMKAICEELKEEFDFILIDCPPQLSILTINALSCADGVLIPVKTDYLAYRGLTQLQDSIREIQELINPDLQVMGVIATLYDTRVTDDREILGLLKEEYNLLGVVKRLAVAKKGIYDGLAVVEQAPNSEISAEYKAVAEMIISGNMKREEQCHG